MDQSSSPDFSRSDPGTADITHQLQRWAEGETEAFEKVIFHIYNDLKRTARAYLRREKPDHTLQPTALIHEAFLKMSGEKQVSFENRSRFFAYAAQIMRRILVDHARKRLTEKHGGQLSRVPLSDAIMGENPLDPDTLIQLDSALQQLNEIDPMKTQLIELRFFMGLEFHEIATMLNVSERTIGRKWQTAKIWLAKQIATPS